MSEGNIGWEELWKAGTLIKIKISMWNGLHKVNPKSLGFENTEDFETAMNISEKLVDKYHLKKMKTLQYDARAAIVSRSIDFPLVDGARFVPLNKKKYVLKELDEIYQKFLEARKEFTDNYESYKEHMIPKLRKAITELAKNSDSVETALRIAVAKYPDAKELENKMDIKWDVFNIATAQEERADVNAVAREEQKVKELMEEMIRNFRETVLEKVDSMIELLKDKDKVGGKTINSAVRFLKRVRAINVFRDNVISQKVESLLKVLQEENLGNERGTQLLVSELETTKEALKEDVKETLERSVAAFKMGTRKLK